MKVQRRTDPPGDGIWRWVLFLLVFGFALLWLWGCAAAPSDSHPMDGWLNAIAPWATGFLILAMVAGLTWYFRAFSRLAFIGERVVEVCGTEKAALRLIAQIEADNAARLAGALSAASFGAHKGPMDER